MSDLEAHPNLRLLMHESRKPTLTEAGCGYVASRQRVLEDIADIKRKACGEYQAPQWEPVIRVPQVMSRTDVMPAIAEFLHAFPQSTCTRP